VNRLVSRSVAAVACVALAAGPTGAAAAAMPAVLGVALYEHPCGRKSLVMPIIDGGSIGLTASNTVLRTGAGDR
jgi:hypothetical protein